VQFFCLTVYIPIKIVANQVQVTHPFEKRRRRQICADNVTTSKAGEKKVQLSRIGSRPEAFQRAIDEVRIRYPYPEGWLKKRICRIVDKIQFLLNNTCYRILCVKTINDRVVL